MELNALLDRIGGPNVAIAIGVGIVGVWLLLRLFRRPPESPHLTTRRCPDCKWTGQVSKYKPVCPNCGNHLGPTY